MNFQEYLNTTCTICRTIENSTVLFPENLDDLSATPKVFSARRLPDRRSYRWVICDRCGLYRSDPVLKTDLDDLYRNSTFDYLDETHGLRKTYKKIVLRAIAPNKPKGHILEIGTGNGFFLEEALMMGFKSVEGVEPSQAAVAAANPQIQKNIKVRMFDRESVDNETADVITIFHTLDHLTDPLSLLEILRDKLKLGGQVVIAVHNTHAISARILKSRSPIFDIEHTFLFSRRTLVTLLHKAGYEEIQTGSYWNQYSLAYIVQLLPIQKKVKDFLLTGTSRQVLSRIRLKFPLGNIWAAARKVN